MEVQKHNALHALSQGNQKLSQMQTEYAERYGTSDINIQDGVINYKEDEPSDS